MEQHLHVFGVDAVHDQSQAHGEQAENQGADAALGRQSPHLPPEPFAGDHGLGHRRQELCQIATHLTLDADGHHRPLEVGAPKPGGHVVERVLEHPAQTGLGQHPAQFATHGVVDLLGHGVHALHQRVAGPQRAGEELQHVRQLRHELALALP